jgi:CBS domain-containing protein
MDTSRNVLLARTVMQRAVFVLRQDRQVLDAVDDLIQRGFSGAPVTDRGRLVGVFSERDALAAIAAAHYEDEPPGTVAQHMRRDFAVVGADADVFEVASVFQRQPIRRVPVVDTERRLLGIISRGDVLKALRRTFPSRQPNKYEQMQERLSLRQGQH